MTDRPGGQYSTRILPTFLSGTSAPRRNVVLRLLLFDFATGHSDIRQRHQEAIETILLPALRARGLCVWIGGLASRRGDEAFNQNLAAARARRVADRVRFLAERRVGMEVTSFGEGHSVHGSINSEYYRSVLIVVTRQPPPPRRERRTPPPRAALSTRFKITLSRSFQGGEGLEFGSYHFLIDYDERFAGAPPSDPVGYRLSAAGIGAGLPVSVGGGTPIWNRFTTAGVVSTRDFEGWGSFGSGGAAAGESGVGVSVLRLWPDRLPSFRIDSFAARSLGAGISMIGGWFTIID